MVKEPSSMDDVVYFSRRKINGQLLKAWVYRGACPKCKKGIMGKLRDPKTGKVKMRAKEYQCPDCHFIIEKEAYESSLTCEIAYTCPHCEKEGEGTAPFVWKKVGVLNEETGKRKSVAMIRFTCPSCQKGIDVTKKMK